MSCIGWDSGDLHASAADSTIWSKRFGRQGRVPQEAPWRVVQPPTRLSGNVWGSRLPPATTMDDSLSCGHWVSPTVWSNHAIWRCCTTESNSLGVPVLAQSDEASPDSRGTTWSWWSSLQSLAIRSCPTIQGISGSHRGHAYRNCNWSNSMVH